MSKTKIEWVKNADGSQGYTINPVKGLCPMACSYCYARRMYKRFNWNPDIRMEPDWMEELPKKPSRIFVGSTMELFGDWVEEWMWDSISEYVKDYPQHTFIFLTKQPQNLQRWAFPKNCWVGISATDERMYACSMVHLIGVQATVKFVSFEPLLSHIDKMLLQNTLPALDWMICGQQTPVNQETKPEVEWLENIVNSADKLNLPIFLKNNLDTLLPKYWDDGVNFRNSDGTLRQEFPLPDKQKER